MSWDEKVIDKALLVHHYRAETYVEHGLQCFVVFRLFLKMFFLKSLNPFRTETISATARKKDCLQVCSDPLTFFSNLAPINGISPTKGDKCDNEVAFYKKATSILLMR